MRYFFVKSPVQVGAENVITGSDAKHIKNVLRMKAGDKIWLFDGKGFEYEARITDVSSKSVGVSIIDAFPSDSESPVSITVAQAFLKERKMDGLVRQITELGITRWIPFFSERSVSRPDEKRLQTRLTRWKKIAKESLKQCRRGRVPEIAETVSFESVLDLSLASDIKIIFWENEPEAIPFPVMQPAAKKNKRIFLIIGPEGGFAGPEVAAAGRFGFYSATLGPRILKAETATVAACTLVQFLYGDLGPKKS